jgi:hypothetical protein
MVFPEFIGFSLIADAARQLGAMISSRVDPAASAANLAAATIERGGAIGKFLLNMHSIGAGYRCQKGAARAARAVNAQLLKSAPEPACPAV